jgi:hypothetical protein
VQGNPIIDDDGIPIVNPPKTKLADDVGLPPELVEAPIAVDAGR